jgi:signal transduction histidine kinase
MVYPKPGTIMKRRSKSAGKSRKRGRRKPAAPKRPDAPAARRSPVADRKIVLARLTRERDEALEQLSAASDVLRVISSSPGELEPVFNAVLENATRLCEAKLGVLFLFEGGRFRPVALVGPSSEWQTYVKERGAFVPTPDQPIRQLLQTKRVVHAFADSEGEAPIAAFRFGGARVFIAVPMLKDDELVGAINIFRQEARPFSDKQIALVQNFAAQAVIAIENARLLNELRHRTADLSESLEQQTATSEVLRVISSSRGELQPVFEAMLENAVRICQASFGNLWLRHDDKFQIVAIHGGLKEYRDYLFAEPLVKPDAESAMARIARTGEAVQIEDISNAPTHGMRMRIATIKIAKARTLVGVPMLKDKDVVGIIAVYRQEVRPFNDKQIQLLKNFAAQAVIAIENARLLNELRQSLEQQTATADVLKVISRSTFDLQAVLDTLVESATRLCHADRSAIRLAKTDGLYHNVASYGFSPEHRARMEHQPLKVNEDSIVGRVVLRRKSVHLVDSQADPHRELANRSRSGNTHTLLGVPLQREGTPIGVLLLQRTIVQAFTDSEIALAETFADQAVIAIENVRLFEAEQERTRELSESLQQQTATADVLKVISRSTFDLRTVLQTLVESVARLCDADMAAVRRPKGSAFLHVASHGAPTEYDVYMQSQPIEAGRGTVSGRVLLEAKPVHVADVQADPEYAMVDISRRTGYHTILGLPLLREGQPIGVVILGRTTVRPFTEKQIELATTFADQAVIAIENVRLFDEIQDKSRQLEQASKHKSQFLANMSHELRTPLNAILGYTELMMDGAYGEPSEKMQGVLKRLEANGRHLLGLINDVLDLSKIESGQLTLDLGDYSLQSVTHTVYSAVEPLAADKKLAFSVEVAPDLPQGRGDERRLTQVLLNLVGNAIKFTDAGEVTIKVGLGDGAFNVAVRDTGPGISLADQAKLFQEFQQADNSITRKKGGTGLGLAISKRIVEMHGGRIWIESAVGQGSTFSFTVPVRVERQTA